MKIQYVTPLQVLGTAVAHAALLLAAACAPPEPPPPRPIKAKAVANAPAPAIEETAQSRNAKRRDGLQGGTLVFEDKFERAEPGADWNVKFAGEWTIEDGQLISHKVQNDDDRNQGVWLNKPLPAKVRVTFQSRSLSGVGDTKCEIFNEQAKHETGYSVIFGGWNNTINTIARKGEHEQQRAVQGEHVKVKVNQTYTWTIVRNDHVVRWYIDGHFMVAYDDADAVRGGFFGFNNWATDVRFDNLQIYEL